MKQLLEGPHLSIPLFVLRKNLQNLSSLGLEENNSTIALAYIILFIYFWVYKE